MEDFDQEQDDQMQAWAHQLERDRRQMEIDELLLRAPDQHRQLELNRLTSEANLKALRYGLDRIFHPEKYHDR